MREPVTLDMMTAFSTVLHNVIASDYEIISFIVAFLIALFVLVHVNVIEETSSTVDTSRIYKLLGVKLK